jgi:hypothetical protein
MGDYLHFRKMITPVFIQVIFWVAIAGIVIAALVQIANDAAAAGILTLVFGPLLVRVYAEILMVMFRINDNVAAIRHERSGSAAENSLT